MGLPNEHDPATPALERLRAHGLQAEVIGDRLEVFPADRLTDDLRDFIRQHKDVLRRELTHPLVPLRGSCTPAQGPSSPIGRRFFDHQYVFVESNQGPPRRGVVIGEPETETMRDGSQARWYVIAFDNGSWSYTCEGRLREPLEGEPK